MGEQLDLRDATIDAQNEIIKQLRHDLERAQAKANRSAIMAGVVADERDYFRQQLDTARQSRARLVRLVRKGINRRILEVWR